jgi:hypothetical protein
LYVANTGVHDVLVIHRGQTTAYNAYIDPSVQYPLDVTVAKDGTVIASNLYPVRGPEQGSISTWIGGPNGGTFVGNFPMTNALIGQFIAVQENGSIYFNDVDATFLKGLLWSLSCPAGACGVQTQVAGVSFVFPGSMAFNGSSDLVALNELGGSTEAETFELPNPNPSTFPLVGGPGMAINELDHHLFAPTSKNRVAEYSYPSGKLIGTVPGNAGGFMFGVAVDP